MYNNQTNPNYKCNYDFVPFNTPKYYQNAGKGDLCGYAELELTTVGNLHIGNGFFIEQNGKFISETIKDIDGNPIIPGSSFKGAIKSICRAVSDGCIPPVDEECRNLKNIYCSNKRCIVCDMFGMIGKVSLASKVSITDFISQNSSLNTELVNSQFPPRPKNRKYKNGNTFKGYKFYKINGDSQILKNPIKIEVINSNSKFTGKIFFKNLTKDQLGLLLFSCCIDKNINLKLGGYKNDGLGEVKCNCSKLMVNNKVENNPIDYVNYYINNHGRYFQYNIAKLKEILKPSIKVR